MSGRRRIRTTSRTQTGGGGGGGVDPVLPGDRDVGWASSLEVNDELRPILVLVSQNGEVDSVMNRVVVTATEFTTVEADDAVGYANLTAKLLDDTNVNSVGVAKATNLVGVDDAKVDQGTTLGSEDDTNYDGQNLAVEPPAAGQNEQRSVLQLDMTGWSGFTVDAVRLVTTTPTATTAADLDCSCEIRQVATQPFTENTVTWNNHEDNQGTLIEAVAHTYAQEDLLGAEQEHTVEWTAAGLANILGNWMLIKIVPDAGLLQVLPVEMYSGETGTGSQRPRIEIDATR